MNTHTKTARFAADKLTLRFQGELLQVKVTKPITTPLRASGGSRKQITEFTRKSRKTLLDHFARMDWYNRRATFITLTYHNDIPTWAEAKTHLRAYLKRVFRHFGDVPVIWRIEPQKRGAPHFHLIVIGMPFYAWQDCLKDWQEVTGDSTITNIKIRLLNGAKEVRGYVSKYVAKVDAVSNLDYMPNLAGSAMPGRFWGIENRRNIPWAVLVEIVQGGIAGLYQYKRYARHLWPGVNSKKYTGFSLYVTDIVGWIFLWQHTVERAEK